MKVVQSNKVLRFILGETLERDDKEYLHFRDIAAGKQRAKTEVEQAFVVLTDLWRMGLVDLTRREDRIVRSKDKRIAINLAIGTPAEKLKRLRQFRGYELNKISK